MPDSPQSHPSAARARTQAERRAVTEQRLLDAALRLIAARGSRSMTLAQVGAEAGYSRGIVTHQFGSKDELLTRAAAHAQSAFAVPQTDTHGLQRLLLTVETYLNDLARQGPAGRAFLQMWAEAVASEPALRPVFTERDNDFRALLAGLVAEGVHEGSIRPDADPTAAAVVLVGQLRGIGLQLLITPDTLTQDRITREALHLLRRGLAPDTPTDPAERPVRKKRC